MLDTRLTISHDKVLAHLKKRRVEREANNN